VDTCERQEQEVRLLGGDPKFSSQQHGVDVYMKQNELLASAIVTRAALAKPFSRLRCSAAVTAGGRNAVQLLKLGSLCSSLNICRIDIMQFSAVMSVAARANST
jgi:hypothetical protein